MHRMYKMSKISVFYRESFSGEVSHTAKDEYYGDIEMKDGGMWIYWTRSRDNKTMKTFYPNISIINVNIEVD